MEMHLSIKSTMLDLGYSFNNECNNCVSLLINEYHNFNASLKRHSHGAICSQNSCIACSIKLMSSVRRYILNSSRRYSSSSKDILKSVLCIIENNSSCYSLPNSGIERTRVTAFYFWLIYEFLRVLSKRQKMLQKHSKYNNINGLPIDVGVFKSYLTITEFLKTTLGNKQICGLSFISSQAIEAFNSDCSYNFSQFTSFLQLSSINTLTFEDWNWICRTIIKTFGNILRRLACRTDTLPEGQQTNKRFVLNPTSFLNLLYRFHLYFLHVTELNKCHLVLFNYVLNKFKKNKRVNSFIEGVLNLYAGIAIKMPGSISSTLKNEQNCSISHTGRGHGMTQILGLDALNRDQIPKVYGNEQASRQMYSGRISTNKEETEKIDGFEFVTFETEYDLMEYTRLEEMRTASRTCSHTSPIKKIIPTKTKDITKIKGWKYKLFDSISKDDIEDNNSVDSCKINVLKDEESSKRNKNLNKTIFDITEEDIHLNKLFVKEHEGVIPTAFDICYRKEFSDVLQEINTLYSKSIKFDKDLNDMQAHTCNDDCIFNCPFVEDFLKKYEKIEVSFDIPVAAEEITPSPIKPTNTFTDIEGVDTFNKKIKDKMNAKTNKMLPIRSCYDSRSFFTDKNGNKYILIRGEPIYLDVKQSCNTQEVISNDNKNVFNEPDNSLKAERTVDCKNIASKRVQSDDKTVKNNIQESNTTKKLKTLAPLVNSHNKKAQSLINSKLRKTKNIPFVFSCKAKGDSHLSCLDRKNLDTLRLGVVVNIGYKRPIHKEIINNIELLKKDSVIIDEKWAMLAVSALHSIKRKVSRILVPVVSPSILKVARSFVEETFKKEDKNIESDVENVMSDILDYIERKESHEELKITFDPDICNSVPFKSIQTNNKNGADTKLKRRISLTAANGLSDKCRKENEEHCGYEHCKKGCICHSLNGKFSLIHCGNEQCMFECSCHWVKRILFTGKDHTKQPSLIYDCTAGKSKREIKLPSRFRDVILGREMNVFDSCQTNLINWKYLKNDLAMKESSKIFSKKGSETQLKSPPLTNTCESLSSVKLLSVILSPNKSGTSENASENSTTLQGHKKLNFSIERLSNKLGHRSKNSILKVVENKSLQNDNRKIVSLSEKLPFTSVFVWCTVHHCYNCECNGHVYLLKTSNLITNFQGKEQNLTLKDMSIMLNNKSKRSYYHMHNLQNHSARTCGMLYDYKRRNSSEIFRSKRIQEIENNVMSNTNGFVKVTSSIVPQKHFMEGDNILTIQAQNVGNTLSKAVIVSNSSIKKVLGYKKLAQADTKAVNSSTKKPVFISLTDIAMKKSTPTTSSSHSFVQNIKINKVQFDMRCPQGKKPELSNPTQKVTVKNENKRDITTSNDEEAPKNPRKRYRIGPAHFNAKRISRAITTNHRRVWTQPAAYTREHHQTDPVQLQYGLLCLNEGFGYLPVKEFTINYIRVKDPLTDNIFQTFKDVAAANVWLNRFFKSYLLFENFNISLKWVVVKPGILTKLKIFDKTLLENKSVVVDKNGRLVDKRQFNKDYLSSINNIPMNSLKSDCEPPPLGKKRNLSILSNDDCPLKKKKT